MGNTCGSDAYGGIVGKYGQMFTQMVMAEKAKSMIGGFFGTQTQQTQSLFQNFQTNTLGQMTNGIGQFQKQFTGIEQALASQIPGGLQSFLPNGRSFQDAVGFTGVMNQLNGLQNDTKQQIQRQLAQATSGLQTMESQTMAQINQSSPMIPQFAKLSDSLKRSIMERASTDYKDQIASNNNSMMQQLGPAVARSVQGYKNQLQTINPMQKMSGIIGGFQSGFGNQLQGLLPQNILGGMNLGSLLGGFNLGGLGLGNLGNIAGMAGGLSNGIGGITNMIGGMTNNIGNMAQGGMNTVANATMNGANNLMGGVGGMF